MIRSLGHVEPVSSFRTTLCLHQHHASVSGPHRGKSRGCSDRHAVLQKELLDPLEA